MLVTIPATSILYARDGDVFTLKKPPKEKQIDKRTFSYGLLAGTMLLGNTTGEAADNAAFGAEVFSYGTGLFGSDGSGTLIGFV